MEIINNRIIYKGKNNNEGEGGGSDFVPMIVQSQGVSTLFNNIYFYGDVTTEAALAINKEIKKLSVELLHTNLSYGLESHINLYLNTDGGDLFAAFSIVDAMRLSPIPVETIIDGLAASAGTVISIHGAKRYITSNSYMLIHQLSTFNAGTYESIKDGMMNADKLMLKLKGMYKKKSKMTNKEIAEIMKHDLFLGSEEAFQMGLVDGVL